MKKFNIYINGAGSLSAEKVGVHASGTKIATITAISPRKALTMATLQIKNNIIKLPAIEDTPKEDRLLQQLDSERELKKVIFCDFHGVLDNGEIHHDIRDAYYRLPKESCPHKIVMLLKLAIKHDASIIITSLHRHDIENYQAVFVRCLKHCNIEEYTDFYNENRKTIKRLTRTYATGFGNDRRSEVREAIFMHEYSHFIVFEDEHTIGEDLNEVRTCTYTGLTTAHIERADTLLNKDMRGA
jgi:hypothetical protein